MENQNPLVNNLPNSETESNVPRTIAGPVRTAVQLAPAAVITEFIDVFVYDFDERQYAVALAGLTLVISYVQNFIESRKKKALLR